MKERFYAGRYHEILAETYDAGAAIAPGDVGFVVGALTFVGRADEATALFDAWQRTGDGDPRTRAACVFFLGLAAARAGDFARSAQLLVGRGFAARHDRDPWVRAFVFQGLACQCYFTGRYPAAARLALRAMHAAHEASFLYAAMLGTDLRGHALIQMGQLERGIAMLEQAKKLASRLGLANNAFAVDTSIATYTTRFSPEPEALERVETLLHRRAHDSYSHRALLTEAAIQRALRGRRADALDALDAADRDALRGDTRRAKVTTLIARLWVTRWQHGPVACGPLLDQAAQVVEPRDIGYRAEVASFALLVAHATGDTARTERVLAELRELARTSHHFAARSALAQFDAAVPPRAFDEDKVTPILRAVVRRDRAVLARVVALGLHGLLPELLGFTPGRRIILIPSEDLAVLEDHGEVLVRHHPPRWCPVLLRLLAGGASKERIVNGLWGLRTYRPELHDPPVRTTIHRLRTFLGPHGRWIEVADDGYRVTVPVHLVGGGERALEAGPLWDEGEVPSLDTHRPPPTRAPAVVADTASQLVERIALLGQASVPELARSLDVSRSTVLRALRDLVRDHRVERIGFARATRYRAW